MMHQIGLCESTMESLKLRSSAIPISSNTTIPVKRKPESRHPNRALMRDWKGECTGESHRMDHAEAKIEVPLEAAPKARYYRLWQKEG